MRMRLALFCAASAIAWLLASAASAAAAPFTADLHFGETDPEVFALQSFLNAQGYELAASGPGSAGHETDYFGPLLRAALEKFQTAHAIPATGYFGPLTRAAANAVDAISSESAAASSSAASTIPAWYALFEQNAPGPDWQPGYGGGSVAENQQSSPPPDTTPPTVSLTAPSGGETLAGSIELVASSSDNVGVASIQFAVDGTEVGGRVTSAPYAYEWDSSTLADGSHTLTATARDAADTIATSTGVVVVIENTPPAFSIIQSNANGDDTGEIITWSTQEQADSKVVYGTTNGGPYPHTVYSGTLTALHTLTLSGLAGGQYYFEAVSTNAAGVAATSTQQSFVLIVLG